MTHIYIPSAPLNTYIDAFYYLDGQMPYPREKIMPDARLDLKINFGGTVNAYSADQTAPLATCSNSWWVGVWNTYHVVNWPQDVDCFGVSFKLGGAYPFISMPLFELHNGVVSLDMIWGSFAEEIRERLYCAPTLQARFELLERLLLTRLGDVPEDVSAVQHALKQIARKQGVLSIRDLSDEMGMSQNHLGNLFKRFVGGTSKDLARLYRFKRVLKSIEPLQPVDWTYLAHQSLYYDQSHFNKDFMAFTGHAPGDYLRLRRQVHAQNPQHAQFLRALPTD